VPPWTLDAYAPAGCLRGTVRGALALSVACVEPADAVALALTPRARRGPMRAGLGWMRSPVARGSEMWWHNGGTHGSRAFTGFVPATGVAVAAVTNSPRSPDRAATQALAAVQPSDGQPSS
jgi:CubicO group peptidase (beta-lactamase class C family)